MPSAELSSVERTAMQLLKQLRESDVQDVKNTLIDITADGVISEDERADLERILEYLDGLIKAAGELKLIGTKVLGQSRSEK